jgi:hypothetical protein
MKLTLNVSKVRIVQLFVGSIAASAVSFPLSATAATLYVSDSGTGSIKQISSTGTVTTFLTGHRYYHRWYGSIADEKETQIISKRRVDIYIAIAEQKAT